MRATLKSIPALATTKFIHLPRKLPSGAKDPDAFLVYCDLCKGKLDPYRGVPIQSVAMLPYLRGAMALPAGASERMSRSMPFWTPRRWIAALARSRSPS